MQNKNNEIESLSKELQKLHIREAEIKDRINAITTNTSSTDNILPLHRLDWDGNKIQLGDKVLFIKKGKYKSTGSFVKRLSRSQDYFVAIIDEF